MTFLFLLLRADNIGCLFFETTKSGISYNGMWTHSQNWSIEIVSCSKEVPYFF